MNLQSGNIAGKTRIKPLLVIFAYNILFMAASGLLVPGTPLYLSTNGFDGGSVNLLLSSIAVSSLIGQVAWGYLSDKAMDRLFFLKLGTAGYALGYLAIVLLKNRLALAILLVATSFVGSASYPAAMALLSETSSTKNRGRSMGVFLVSRLPGLGHFSRVHRIRNKRVGWRILFRPLFTPLFCFTRPRPPVFKD